MLEWGRADKQSICPYCPIFQQDQKTKLQEEIRTVIVFQIQDLMSNFP